MSNFARELDKADDALRRATSHTNDPRVIDIVTQCRESVCVLLDEAILADLGLNPNQAAIERHMSPGVKCVGCGE